MNWYYVLAGAAVLEAALQGVRGTQPIERTPALVGVNILTYILLAWVFIDVGRQLG